MMFTGIIEKTGRVSSVLKSAESLWVEFEHDLGEIEEGESIAVDGVCLTALSPTRSTFAADVSYETLKLTNLGALTKGHEVNLERALEYGDRLGGHLVSGHVDGTATVTSMRRVDDCVEFRFLMSDVSLIQYCLHKGSVCINGVSLTLNQVDLPAGEFQIALIPHTLAVTTLKHLDVGHRVNVECDWTLKTFLANAPVHLRYANSRGVTIC